MVTTKLSALFAKEHFEEMSSKEGFLACGVDEVGRGCLAGPVVASAAIIKPGSKSFKLDDSKLLSPTQREVAYEWLMQNSWHSTAIIHNRIIDSVNIYQATLIAMKRAVMQLCIAHNKTPALILVDAMPLQLPEIYFEHTDNDQLDVLQNPWNKVIYFNRGESKSRSIAAASIIAKVTRDRLMHTLQPVFPGFSLGQHKGYGTVLHKHELQATGATVIHRQSFL